MQHGWIGMARDEEWWSGARSVKLAAIAPTDLRMAGGDAAVIVRHGDKIADRGIVE